MGNQTWEERVEAARRAGAAVIAPNGLPIACIRYDGTLLEHEHADHPGYVIPVRVEFVGELPPDLDPLDPSYEPEDHALLFAGGNVLLTIYECRYDIWLADNGRHLGGPEWYAGWRVSEKSLAEVRSRSDRSP